MASKLLTVLVVDDEPLARETVRDLLALDPEVELVGECGDGRTALDRIRERGPDIVFLDIEMPARSGIDALAALPARERPVVVYVTAYAEHAARAYDLEAVDYVLKPFSDRRFFEALERAKRRVREGALLAFAASLTARPQEERRAPESRAAGGEAPPAGGEARPTSAEARSVGTEARAACAEARPASGETRPANQGRYIDRFAVKRGDRQVLVPADRIRWIESEDYYVRLHLDDAGYLLRTSLAALEERLDPARFQRVHRTAIVRRDVVREVRTLPSGVRVLLLDDDTELPVSRARAREVQEWLAPRLR